jgi:alanine racemase
MPWVESQVKDNIGIEELAGSLKKAQEIDRVYSRLSKIKGNIHISLDCGNLGRDGFNVSSPGLVHNMLEDVSEIAKLKSIEVVGISSHFSSPETDSEDDLCRQALSFIDISNQIKRIVNKHGMFPAIHMAASESVIRLPDEIKKDLDFMRIGRILYGLMPKARIDIKPTLPVMSVFCFKLAEHLREAGQSIGYCRTYQCSKVSSITTLSIGWAILLPTSLSCLKIFDENGSRYVTRGYGAMNAMMVEKISTSDSPGKNGSVFMLAGRSGQSLTDIACQEGMVPPTLTISAGNNHMAKRVII